MVKIKPESIECLAPTLSCLTTSPKLFLGTDSGFLENFMVGPVWGQCSFTTNHRWASSVPETILSLLY